MAQINLKVLTNIQQSEKQLEALKSSVESISKSLSSVSVNPKLTAQINALTNHYNAVAKAAEKVAKVNYHNEIEAQKLAKATAQANKAIADETTAIEKSKTQFAKHQKAVNDDARAQEKHEAQMKKSTAQTQKATEQTQKHSQSLATMIPNIIKWQVAMTAVMLPLRKLQQGLESINETLVETEKRVVALRRVAGDAANATALYDLAQKYGQTFENVADVVENLVKSGYTWEESLKAAEPALLAINVAELDATQATEGLIAVVKQYGMELEDLNYIQGVLNKTADNAAVTTEKLLIALQKTGSTAKNANISFEETVGLITALSEGTAASGQNIGNALRSLIVFTSDSKALDTFAGLSSGMAETVKNYRAGQASILDIWKGLGGELQGMNSQKGTLEDLFGGAEMTADIEAQLTQITDSFAEIYGTAGNYRQNYFIALLDNIEKVEDATKDLGDATSYSQKENDKYLQTYEAKVNQLNAQWKDIANDEQGFLAFKKGLVDVGSNLLSLLESVGGLGGLFQIAYTVASPFLAKWTLTFGIKAISASISGIKAFFSAFQAGAMTANMYLGAISVVLGAITLSMNAAQASAEKSFKNISEYASKAIEAQDSLSQKVSDLENNTKKYIDQIVELKTVLDSSAYTEKEKESAQSELLIIQDKLIESNKNYAGSLDLVNGKLEDQVELLNQSKYDQQKQAVIDYYKENTDAYSKIDEYFGRTDWKLRFDENVDVWGNGGEFQKWLADSGYLASSISQSKDTFSAIGDAVASFFGAKTLNTTAVNFDGLTITQIRSTLYNMLRKAEQEGASEYIIGQIQGQINSIENDPTYQQMMALKIGDAESSDFVSTLSAEQVRAIAKGTMSDAEFEKLVNDFFKIEESTGETKDNVNGINKVLSDLNDTTLKETIEKLRQARDLTHSTYEYEEKKKAVLEAEQKLLDLQNNRTSYVLNRETGQWEWMVNERELQKAEEELEQARYEVEKAAYDNIIEELENGNDTSKALLKVVALWAGAYGSGDFSAVEKTITSILRDAGYLSYKPSDWKNPENAILSHEGLLFDTPNSMSHQGLLFGTPSRIPMSSEINRNNTFSDSHNVTYHVNGVPISSGAAETFTVGQLIRELGNYY